MNDSLRSSKPVFPTCVMRRQPFGVIVAVVIALASASDCRAATARVSWALCPFPQSHAIVDADESPHFNLWLTGMVEEFCGFRATVELVAADGGSIPDAWRFDSGGCQEGWMYPYFGISPIPGPCSSPTPPSPDSVLWSAYAVHSPPTGPEEFKVEARYGPCRTGVEPQRAYGLVMFGLYFIDAVVGASAENTCGGLERGVCARISEAAYLKADGSWIPVDSGEDVLTASMETTANFACFETSSLTTSWGRVKASYHR